MNKIAILLTCYNRKDKTKIALSRLYQIEQDVDIFLVDDGSTDGTQDEVRNNFQEVYIIKGNGNLFWNRGMALAWKHAMKQEYDYYIWLNDDVALYSYALEEIFNVSAKFYNKAIISGIIETKDKTTILYGGFDRNKKIVIPDGKPQEIHHLNGNFVLVPRYVFNILGNLDKKYHHDLGDVDYGLRAIKKGISVVSTTKAIGYGQINNLVRVRLNRVTLKERFKKLYSPLGSNPNINFYFRKKHYGLIKAIAFYLHLNLINLLPDKIINKIFGNKYD